MKRILILANAVGGLYNFRFELIQELISEGYELFFSLPEDHDDDKVKQIVELGARHIQTNINRRGINVFEDLRLIKEYKKIINRINPDVILTYTIKPNIYGTYAANKYKKPLIINVTGIGTSLTVSKLKYLVTYLYRYACNRASIVFFQNESNRSLFLSKNIVNNDKTKIIPGSGVNIEKFRPLERKNNDNILRFLFIGRIMKEKGIEEYLSVADDLSKKHSNIEFQILGRFEEKEYRKKIENNKNHKIKYLGVSNDVREQIKEVDCIVNPSYHEGMSNVLLEGAAMGKLLLASNIPGCREIIEDGYNGFLFKAKSISSLKDKINKFIKLKKKEREIMGLNSREKVVNEFDRKIVINEYIKAIDNILKKE